MRNGRESISLEQPSQDHAMLEILNGLPKMLVLLLLIATVLRGTPGIAIASVTQTLTVAATSFRKGPRWYSNQVEVVSTS
jgi:hypothetical protein